MAASFTDEILEPVEFKSSWKRERYRLAFVDRAVAVSVRPTKYFGPRAHQSRNPALIIAY